jgi:tetratricopeptide (TPR) repeat protein
VFLCLRGFLISVFSLCAVCAHAQTRTAPAALGTISFPNSGSAAAQPQFIRGVLLLHSFEYDDAIEAFRQAQKSDPDFALAYWGEAMCYNQPLWYNENVDKGRAVLARLAPTRDARRAKAPTAREKGYLDAVETLYGHGDKHARDRAYGDRMAELSRHFPDDDEAAAFHTLALLATIPSGQRNPDVSLKAGAIATAILRKHPEHPGAAHYALHAFDDGEHAAMGLPAARSYARIAPASSHARHMPSHVFLPLGMWDEAAASDASSFAASVDRVKRLGQSMAQADFHSLSWLHYEYLQQGQFDKAREAEQTVRNAIAASGARGFSRANPSGHGSAEASHGSAEASPSSNRHAESEIGRGFSATSLKSELGSMRARRVIESGSWTEMKGQGSFENIDELFALGVASVKLGDRARGEAALEHLGTAARTVPDTDARDIAAIMREELDGLMRIAAGDSQGGLAALARAAGGEAERPKPIARPYPIKPAGELYAEALLGAGDAIAAVTAFHEALARTPRRAGSLLGLARAAQKAGRRADAVSAAKEFLAMWHLADASRPELVEVRQILKTPNR